MKPVTALRASLAILSLSSSAAIAQPTPDSSLASPEVIKLWASPPKDTAGWSGPETTQTLPLPGGKIRMVGNVTMPTLTVFRPAAGKNAHTAIIVIPGGGFQGLAVDHEGEMVARWLNEIGVTALVLKYRVHSTPGFHIPPGLRDHPERFAAFASQFEPGRTIAIADATQAMHLVRQEAARLGIAPDRVGMIGFFGRGDHGDGRVAERPPHRAAEFRGLDLWCARRRQSATQGFPAAISRRNPG